MSVCPPGTSARFCNVPGAGAFGGFDSSAGLRLRLLLLLARDVQSCSAIGRAFSAFVCGVTRVPPPLGVRCALFSVFVGVGRVSSALIKLTCFSVGLRLRASPSGFAFGLRLRASPSSGFAFGLRLLALPSGFAFGPARSHDPAHNPWAMPGIVSGFPAKHPRHTAVVFATEHHRAAFWRVSCFICCDLPPTPRARLLSHAWHSSRGRLHLLRRWRHLKRHPGPPVVRKVHLKYPRRCSVRENASF